MNDDVITVIKSYAGITPLDIANAYWKWYPELSIMKYVPFKIKQMYKLIQLIQRLYKPSNIDSCNISHVNDYIKLIIINNKLPICYDYFSIGIAFYLCGYTLNTYQHYKNPLQCRVLNCDKTSYKE